MKVEDLISECTAYDFKLKLEEKKPKSLEDAIEMTSAWMEYYNRERPHSSLKNCSPLMYRENHACPLPANF